MVKTITNQQKPKSFSVPSLSGYNFPLSVLPPQAASYLTEEFDLFRVENSQFPRGFNPHDLFRAKLKPIVEPVIVPAPKVPVAYTPINFQKVIETSREQSNTITHII